MYLNLDCMLADGIANYGFCILVIKLLYLDFIENPDLVSYTVITNRMRNIHAEINLILICPWLVK